MADPGADPAAVAGRGSLPADAVVLALDLGGTQIRVAAILPDGERVGRLSAPTPRGTEPEAIFAACADLLRALESGLSAELAARVIAVGISSMGPVDPWRGVVVDPPNVPALREAPLADEMERRLALPAFLDRDTCVAALAERWLGAAAGCRDFIYVTVSTGLGAAIVRQGELVHGPDGAAGELGHVTLMPVDGPRCGCGGIGHLEAIASGSGLAAQARQVVETGVMPTATGWPVDWVAPDPLLVSPRPPVRSEYLERCAATGPITGRDVALGDDAGDEVCRLLMVRARRAFAVACVGWVDAFNPERIVVGGTVADGQGDRLLGPARDEVAWRAFHQPSRRVQILPAALGPDVGLVGAWPLVAERFGAAEWRERRAGAAPARVG